MKIHTSRDGKRSVKSVSSSAASSCNWLQLSQLISEKQPIPTENRDKKRRLLQEPETCIIKKRLVPRGSSYTSHTCHKHSSLSDGRLLALLSGFEHEPLPLKLQREGKYIALDCEMVGVGPPPHKKSALARVSIVNYYGHTLLDVYVKPKEKITDYRTYVSGITPALIYGGNAVDYEHAQALVAKLLKGKILIGHALHNDQKVLLLSHPKQDMRDTATYRPFLDNHNGGRSALSLRKLALGELGLSIQQGAHSSVDDARCVMALYHRVRNEWESGLRRTP